jgi:hypothetical protein
MRGAVELCLYTHTQQPHPPIQSTVTGHALHTQEPWAMAYSALEAARMSTREREMRASCIVDAAWWRYRKSHMV